MAIADRRPYTPDDIISEARVAVPVKKEEERPLTAVEAKEASLFLEHMIAVRKDNHPGPANQISVEKLRLRAERFTRVITEYQRSLPPKRP